MDTKQKPQRHVVTETRLIPAHIWIWKTLINDNSSSNTSMCYSADTKPEGLYT